MSGRQDELALWRITALRGRRRVVDDVTLRVGPGEIVAVIGPNGGGHTSLLEAAIGAIPVASGEVRVGSRTLRGLEERARCFHFLSGEAEPPAEVRVATLLDHAGSAPGADRNLAAELRDRLGLHDLGNVPAGALS